MAGKKNLGKVIGQVGGLRIRQMNKTTTLKGKTQTSGTEFGIFKGKNKVEVHTSKASAFLKAGQITGLSIK
jgi:hypothetical protein